MSRTTKPQSDALQDALAYVETIPITLPQLEAADLARRACNYHDSQTGGRARPSDEPEFVARLCVHFLNHRRFPCDERHLITLDNLIGGDPDVRSAAYDRLRCRILGAIAEQYPHLAREARRQFREGSTC